MKIVLGLIALVLGYRAFLDACKEKEGLKLLGQVIGIVVMIGALLTVLCGAMHCMGKYGSYGMMGKGYGSMMKSCPISGIQK
ncbi:MAG TPA: hypothetical protein VD883_02590 [Candidatus Omnitrophota bacterium]|nr:hypothetical protein [Candidatus Omnitrophota bacterium]